MNKLYKNITKEMIEKAVKDVLGDYEMRLHSICNGVPYYIPYKVKHEKQIPVKKKDKRKKRTSKCKQTFRKHVLKEKNGRS